MLEKILKKFYGDRYEAVCLERELAQAQVKNPDISICFYAEAPNFFDRGGKVKAFEYLPTFCNELRKLGAATHFLSTRKELKRFVGGKQKTVLVCIYQEEEFTPQDQDLLDLIDKADLVFNHPRIGQIIKDKFKTHAVLTKAGCKMPQLASALPKNAEIFSNEAATTAAEAFITHNDADLEDDRFNTEFIDTRMEYAGQTYHTTMRLMCVDNRITHSYVRARNTAENNPSVHAKDTPKDAALVNHFWNELSNQYKEQFQTIADQVFKALGPGFYSHDTLIDHRTKTAFVCETGFKFNDKAYERSLEPVKTDLIGLKGHFDPPKSAATTAPIFLERIKENLIAR